MRVPDSHCARDAKPPARESLDSLRARAQPPRVSLSTALRAPRNLRTSHARVHIGSTSQDPPARARAEAWPPSSSAQDEMDARSDAAMAAAAAVAAAAARRAILLFGKGVPKCCRVVGVDFGYPTYPPRPSNIQFQPCSAAFCVLLPLLPSLRPSWQQFCSFPSISEQFRSSGSIWEYLEVSAVSGVSRGLWNAWMFFT